MVTAICSECRTAFSDKKFVTEFEVPNVKTVIVKFFANVRIHLKLKNVDEAPEVLLAPMYTQFM